MRKLALHNLFAVVTIVALLIAVTGCNNRKAEQIRQGVRDIDQHAQEIQRQTICSLKIAAPVRLL